jgi:hypothetical protein
MYLCFITETRLDEMRWGIQYAVTTKMAQRYEARTLGEEN